MSKVLAQADLSKITDTTSFMQYCAKFINDLIPVINGKLEFDSNLLTQTVTATFSNANVDQGISHKLNKTGLRYIICQKDKACDVFDGVTSDTSSTIYLQCTQATSVKLILF